MFVPNDPLCMIQELDIGSTPCLFYHIFTLCPSSSIAISRSDGLMMLLPFIMCMLGSLNDPPCVRMMVVVEA